MAIPIDELTTPLTPEQVKASIYNLLAAMKLPVTSWQPGAVLRTVIAVVSKLFAGYTEVIAEAVKGTLLELATGSALVRLAKYEYNVDAIQATFATGQITLTNAAGGLYTFGPSDLIVKNPATSKTYRNTTPFALAPVGNPGAVVTIDIEAFEIGSASTSAPDQITELVTNLIGVSASNPTPVVGTDAEADEDLRERCKDSLGALSPNGPRAAYLYLSKSALRADGSAIGVTRVKVITGPGDGTLAVYVADSDGPIVPGDLALVDALIQAKAVPECQTATVANAIAVPVSPTIDIWILASAGLSDFEVKQIVRSPLQNYFGAVPIGGYVIPPATLGKVPWKAIVGAVECASPFIIEASVTPASDIMLAASEVAVLTAPTINVHQVPG